MRRVWSFIGVLLAGKSLKLQRSPHLSPSPRIVRAIQDRDCDPYAGTHPRDGYGLLWWWRCRSWLHLGRIAFSDRATLRSDRALLRVSALREGIDLRGKALKTRLADPNWPATVPAYSHFPSFSSKPLRSAVMLLSYPAFCSASDTRQVLGQGRSARCLARHTHVAPRPDSGPSV